MRNSREYHHERYLYLVFYPLYIWYVAVFFSFFSLLLFAKRELQSVVVVGPTKCDQQANILVYYMHWNRIDTINKAWIVGKWEKKSSLSYLDESLFSIVTFVCVVHQSLVYTDNTRTQRIHFADVCESQVLIDKHRKQKQQRYSISIYVFGLELISLCCCHVLSAQSFKLFECAGRHASETIRCDVMCVCVYVCALLSGEF